MIYENYRGTYISIIRTLFFTLIYQEGIKGKNEV
nr:MAG TPA: hypothetical protein [Caudoviricetes sp.]